MPRGSCGTCFLLAVHIPLFRHALVPLAFRLRVSRLTHDTMPECHPFCKRDTQLAVTTHVHEHVGTHLQLGHTCDGAIDVICAGAAAREDRCLQACFRQQVARAHGSTHCLTRHLF